jgi:hypothetical protein
MSRVLASGLCAFFVVALCAACPAAASLNSDKQRVAIVERTNFSGNGTFELIPLSPPPTQCKRARPNRAAVVFHLERGGTSPVPADPLGRG